MMLVGGVLLIVVAMVIAGAHSHKPTQADIDTAQARFQKQFASCMQGRVLGPGAQLPPGYTSLDQFCADACPAISEQTKSPKTILRTTTLSSVFR